MRMASSGTRSRGSHPFPAWKRVATAIAEKATGMGETATQNGSQPPISDPPPRIANTY